MATAAMRAPGASVRLSLREYHGGATETEVVQQGLALSNYAHSIHLLL